MKRFGDTAAVTAATVLQFLVLLVAPVWAGDGIPNDLREIRIGMAARDLPSDGYADLACAAPPARKLASWANSADCPFGASGLREIRFGYDPAIDREGTKVAGHPVILTLLIDEAGSIAGLVIVTDPKSRLYMRKKAFLLGAQAKARYGAEGWNCTERDPAADELAVGGVYVNELCSKTVNDRSVTIERRLFRHADQELRHFVDETRISILAVKG